MDVHATYMPGFYGNDEYPCEGWVSDCGPLLVQVLFAIEPTHMHWKIQGLLKNSKGSYLLSSLHASDMK